jgi:hypothetical protein
VLGNIAVRANQVEAVAVAGGARLALAAIERHASCLCVVQAAVRLLCALARHGFHGARGPAPSCAPVSPAMRREQTVTAGGLRQIMQAIEGFSGQSAHAPMQVCASSHIRSAVCGAALRQLVKCQTA